MYIVTLRQYGSEMVFHFDDGIWAVSFAEKAMMHAAPYVDMDGTSHDLKALIELKKCAGSGNSEVAHTNDQVKDSTEW